MTNSFYRGTDCVLLVFDVSRRSSFDALLQWKKSFLIQIGQDDSDNFPMIVIANKIDRPDRVVCHKWVLILTVAGYKRNGR